ncbi:unnamed protein product [Bursaphelenchus okinawaensis]|uniref:Uncharacterized protein n=1 Tax=Bursaphelenchus okinawaensis TaxID=465554 RepID=A0A811KU42_9BILA|nr:unnamed protein product [Bursaphelenchus okinawaensis]CAG9112421.1 unnamed protein product [Bursaphelenchus okinawaensis]
MGVSECEEKQHILIKQCLFKYMQEVYEDVNDVLQTGALQQLMYRMVREKAECTKFWHLTMCFKFLDPCYDQMWRKEDRAQLNAVFAFKFASCSGFNREESLEIVKCYDRYQQERVCEEQVQNMKTASTCTAEGHKVYTCLQSPEVHSQCREMTKQQYIIVCQLYTFRSVTSCITNNCDIEYIRE